MNLGWEFGNDKQNYVSCVSVSCFNGKITRKEMSKLFLYDYDHCDMVKCRRYEFWRVG